MIQLPHDNYCSMPNVSPKNWETAKASEKNDWYIFYRFYCPDFPKGKLVIIKSGINSFKTRMERKNVAKRLLKDTTDALLEGYNPVKGEYIAPIEINYEINPDTPVCVAFKSALDRVKIEDTTRTDITNILTHVELAAKWLKLDRVKIQEIRKKHIKLILEKVGQTKGDRWTGNTFNHYRKYLSILFKELVELDAIELNPIAGIAKQKTVKKIRQVLTLEERKSINKFLHDHHYRFWIFMQIFFHSGARRTELLKVKGKDVDLENQKIKVTVIKGPLRREVEKTLKDLALPFWKIAMEGCGKNQFVFSQGLKPGDKSINPKQVSRRWRTHIKGVKDKDGNIIGGLGVTADFYSLKHLHTDEVSNLLTLEEAGRHNSHTSTSTTMIYAVNEKERQAERLKKLGNEF